LHEICLSPSTILLLSVSFLVCVKEKDSVNQGGSIPLAES